MLQLGVSLDRYESGVCLSDGDRVLFAANEERFTRRKNQGGWPRRALAAALRTAGIDPADITRVACAGEMTPPLPLVLWPKLHEFFFAEDRTGSTPVRDRIVEFVALATPLAHMRAESRWRSVLGPLRTRGVRRALPRPMQSAPIDFVEHHRAHAAAAWTLSGFPSALAITADSMGDGVSATVSRCADGRIERLWSAAAADSLGRFYETVTAALGFIPSRHEGKVTGLAACGDADAVDVPSPFTVRGGVLRYHAPDGSAGAEWIRHELLARFRREDVCAWAQAILEGHLLEIALEWLRRTEMRRLVVAGGVFANVKLNQRLHELAEIDELFVCPNMGDGGLALGALGATGGIAPARAADVFWGDEPSDAEVRTALTAAAIDAPSPADMDATIAARIAAGGIVGVCRGRMEWGPRALGNRSILAAAVDPSITERLNQKLARSDFMPFAPAVLAEEADAYLHGVGAARSAARFMTCCFRATRRLQEECPAVVHVDGTVRAQLVDAESNPGLYGILAAVRATTGIPVVLNTSFNRHEEPIVRTAAEAIAAFRAAELDALALGDRWVCAQEGPSPRAAGPPQPNGCR